ncbi:precorrin-8X methylmutase, partial [Klebsiella pneumoniae]
GRARRWPAGRKGGSNVAAAIVNALLYHLREAQ